MLLGFHKNYTEKAVATVGIDVDRGEEIVVGSAANDLCEFTNGWENIFRSKEDIDEKFRMETKAFGMNAFWQSHFGELDPMRKG